MLLLITHLLLISTAAGGGAISYFCPRGQVLEGRECHIPVPPTRGIIGDHAGAYCKSRGWHLPLSGEKTWVDISVLDDLDLCIYAFNRRLLLESCDLELPLICTKPSGGWPCEEGWTLASESFQCVRASTKTYRGGVNLPSESEICPADSKLQSYEKLRWWTELDDTMVWTELYLGPSQSILKRGGVTEQILFAQISSLPYQTSGTGEVGMRMGAEVLPFYCITSATEMTREEQQKGNGTVCPEGDVLSEGFCYRNTNRTRLMRHSAAREECKKHGYGLTKKAVPALRFSTGWIDAEFDASRMLDPNIRGYLWKSTSTIYLGEEDRKAWTLCFVPRVQGGNCIGDAVLGKSPSHCLMESAGKGRWEEAMDRGCLGQGEPITTKQQFLELTEDFEVKLPKEKAYWIGVYVDQNQTLSFISGDRVGEDMLSPRSSSKCYGLLGGEVFPADCGLQKPYLCTRAATTDPDKEEQKDEQQKKKNVVLVVVGVAVPVALFLLVLLLIFKKKGMNMCFREPETFEDAADNKGVIIMNPLSEGAPAPVTTDFPEKN